MATKRSVSSSSVLESGGQRSSNFVRTTAASTSAGVSSGQKRTRITGPESETKEDHNGGGRKYSGDVRRRLGSGHDEEGIQRNRAHGNPEAMREPRGNAAAAATSISSRLGPRISAPRRDRSPVNNTSPGSSRRSSEPVVRKRISGPGPMTSSSRTKITFDGSNSSSGSSSARRSSTGGGRGRNDSGGGEKPKSIRKRIEFPGDDDDDVINTNGGTGRVTSSSSKVSIADRLGYKSGISNRISF